MDEYMDEYREVNISENYKLKYEKVGLYDLFIGLIDLNTEKRIIDFHYDIGFDLFGYNDIKDKINKLKDNNIYFYIINKMVELNPRRYEDSDKETYFYQRQKYNSFFCILESMILKIKGEEMKNMKNIKINDVYIDVYGDKEDNQIIVFIEDEKNNKKKIMFLNKDEFYISSNNNIEKYKEDVFIQFFIKAYRNFNNNKNEYKQDYNKIIDVLLKM